MIREIVTKKADLSLTCEEIFNAEKIYQVVNDMIDTASLAASKPPGCIGLAANQIGELYRIIIIWHGGKWLVMLNPELEPMKGQKEYAKEGCLSRPGIQTKKRRYKKLKVTYSCWPNYDDAVIEQYTGLTARVIQHEIDHLNGVYI